MSRQGMEACGKIGILARCEELHMMNTGAAEPDPTLIEEDKKVLQIVLNNWESGHKKWYEYDDAVKNLVRIALTERNWLYG